MPDPPAMPDISADEYMTRFRIRQQAERLLTGVAEQEHAASALAHAKQILKSSV